MYWPWNHKTLFSNTCGWFSFYQFGKCPSRKSMSPVTQIPSVAIGVSIDEYHADGLCPLDSLELIRNDREHWTSQMPPLFYSFICQVP